MDEDGPEGHTFGQRQPPLYVTIQKILDKYPDGQIFKEIIQNADDAGATTVHFYLDNRQHDSGSLIYPSLHQFQGPALLSYNDAMFQDKDWQSIQDMQQSVKAEDPFKVGKFGIGFNSVYHITDLPTIVSGNRLAYLDPHEELWLKETGQWYDINRNTHCSDTFAPFEGLCGFSTRSGAYYSSTLFRFPLRNVSRQKRVSHHTYDIAKLRNLLTALRNEAKCILLFLRSVRKVEVFEIDASGHHSSIFNVSISEVDYDQLSEKRLQFKRNLQSRFERESFGISSNLIEVVRVKVDINDSQKRQTSSSQWIVAHQVGSGSQEIRELAKELKVFPWIGVALETSARGATSGGRVFCVLPMPQDVNCSLPVHVNGTFSLNDERRELKWRGIERKNDPSAEWNHLLVKELLPSCYANLLLNHAKMVLTPQQFYEAWPDIGQLQNSHWREILTTLLDTLFSNEVIPFSRPGGFPTWIKVSSATFVPRGVQLHDAVTTALVGCGVKLVSLSDRIWNALEFRRIQCTVVSPSLTRAQLKRVPGSYASLDKQHKMELLRYCLSDNQYRDLQGLALLPLANGSFGTFGTTYHSAVYLCSSTCPRSLLPNCDASLVDENIDRSIYAKLNALASGGYTNLQLLKAPNVASLLRSAMPNQSRLILPWSGFNMQWLQRLWGWIPRGELSNFENLLLVPVGNNTIARLSKSSSVLYIPRNTHYTKSLLSALEKLGLECCLQRNHPYIHHSDLSSLMNYFSSDGIVNAVHSASPEYHNISFTNEEASEIVNQVHGIRSLDYQQQAVVRQLPVFKTLENTSNQLYSIQQVGVAQIEPPNFPLNPQTLPQSVILFSGSNHYQKSLLQKISVHCTTTYDILMGSVFPVIESGSIGRNAARMIMKEILEKYKNITSTLGRQNESRFQNKIGGLQFVPVARGRPKAPNQLYSPLEPGLTDIFYGEPVFPMDPFSTGKHIKILKLCGLKTAVSKQEVVDIIGTIGLASSGSPQQADEITMIKARALLGYIKRWENSLSEHVLLAISPLQRRGSCGFAEALKHLFLTKSWMPIEHDRPENYPLCLPWKGSEYNSHLVSSGSSVLLHEKQSSIALACGSQMYFVKHSLPPAMCRLIQPSSDYLTSCMTAHLKVVIQNQNQLSKNGDIKKVVDTIYGYLSRYMNKQCMEDFGTLEECIWLPRHGKFVDPKNTALSENPEFRHNLEPFIYIIHNHEFKDLFTTLGTQETISQDQILEILPKIKDGDPESLGISNEEAWRLVKAILNWLVDSEDGEILEIDEESLLVPVESDEGWPQLVPAKEVVYTDNSFLQEYFDEGEEDYTFVHSCITPQMAERFQLTPLSEHLDIAEDAFEDVGQIEPLTVRLRNILKDYKDGLTIIKELLQNADDAQATEMNICYDRRNHASNQKRLFFPGMVECHGPALVVHNNAKFTEEDFKNITKLAGATKEKKALKIGKFGIGFCSVYHITDIPSFVSDKYLYIFDPTLKYLKDSVKNPAQPGKKVSFTSRFIQKSQQLAPYRDLFEFDPKSEYEGTTFRFPFRTATSELSEKLYKERDVTQLKEDMKTSTSKLILFLPHIKRITFSQISDGESEVNMMMTITKESEELAENRCIEQITCSINDSSDITEFWLVETFSHTVLQKYSTSSVACPLSPIQNKEGCYRVSALKGEVFCFLPLSIKTGLPVHVSSNFAVVNNRRGIWTSEEGGRDNEEEKEANWNRELMKTVICFAYCGLLEALKEMDCDGKLEKYEYFSMWPVKKELEEKNPWHLLIDATYTSITQRELFFSTSTQSWLQLEESKFLDPNILKVSYSSSSVPKSVMEVVNHLELPVVELPAKYLDQIDISDSTESEEAFLEHFFQRIDELKAILQSRNDVLCLALECYTTVLGCPDEDRFCHLNTCLKGNSCIPCEPHGELLKLPEELIHPRAQFAKLYEDEENVFPLQSFCDRQLVDKAMKELGMLYDHIPLERLEERATGIAKIHRADKCKAMERVKLIIECLLNEDKTEEFDSDDLAISKIPFLPVAEKPEDYPLQWKGVPETLYCGKDVIPKGTSHFNSKDSTNLYLAASQVVFLNSDLPFKGGCGFLNPRARDLLHVKSSPDVVQVTAHFNHLIDKFDASKRMVDWAGRISRKVYEYLDDLLKKSGSEEEIDLSAFSERPCIWTGKEFIKSKAVAQDWGEEGPYLYKVPTSMVMRKKLQKALGIRKSFDIKDLVRALQCVAADHGNDPLPINFHKLVMAIIGEIPSGEQFPADLRPLMLPDTNFIMHKALELYYNDMPWKPVDIDYVYVHEKIPLAVAKQFGVQLCRTANLARYNSIAGSGFAIIQFGQHEELTRRIQNIIRDYPFDITILKELLQNADDARAKKLYVILDKREHSKEHVLSDKWGDLQGPALLVWNDSVFSDKDLEGIQELGLGSKRTNSETIGQYGIGFNAVYHLTDCPSFLTGGDKLCILDPHMKYVPQATDRYPGAMYNNLDDKFWDTFDGLKPAYLLSDIKKKPKEMEGGTLFRFPIRHTKKLVEGSEIVHDMEEDKMLTGSDMHNLLKKWAPKMKQSLLFLNNITELKFFVIMGKRGMVQLEHSFRTELDDEAMKTRDRLPGTIKSFQEEGKPEVLTYPINVITEATNTSETTHTEEWLIQQGIGDIREKVKTWKYIDHVKPRHGIAAPISRKVELKAQVFCFLPLPLCSKLPVHINGHFILNSNRRNLWAPTTEDECDDKSRWNQNITQALASSYAGFLERIPVYFPNIQLCSSRDALVTSLKEYYECFPRCKDKNGDTISQPWLSLAKQVYRIMSACNSAVLAVPVRTSDEKYLLQWRALKSEEMPKSQVYFWDSAADYVQEMKSILEKIGMKITYAPSWILQSFKEAEMEIPVVSPSTVFNYYSQFFSCKLPVQIKDTPFGTIEDFKIFTEFLLSESGTFPEEPFDKPLLLNANNELCIFDKENKILKSEYTKLFPESPEKFLHPDLLEVGYSDSYFLSTSDSKEVRLGVVQELLEVILPTELKASSVSVENEEIDLSSIKHLWECFTEDEVFKSVVDEVLKTWALLLTKDHRLFRCESSDQLLPVVPNGGKMEYNIRLILERKFKGPIVETQVVTEDIVLSLCPQLSEPKSILKHLYYLNRESPFAEVMTVEIASKLINYIARIHLAKESRQCHHHLKCLPLFESADGKFTAIDGKSVYVWPMNICKAGTQKWQVDNVVFLNRFGHWTDLGATEVLGICAITAEETYIQFIFPKFSMLNQQERYAHLCHIRDNMFDKNYATQKKVSAAFSFVEELSTLPCIGNDGEALQAVCKFYTHKKAIFCTFPEHFKLLPRQYQESEQEWLSFFEKIGLQMKVSPGVFVKLCSDVALGKMKNKTKTSSKVLMKYLLSYEEQTLHEFHSNESLLIKVSDIAFVSPTKVPELEWMVAAPQASNHVTLGNGEIIPLCKLGGSCLPKHKDLIWAVKPIVPMSSGKQELLKNLKIFEPTGQDVITNIAALSKTCFANPSQLMKYTAPQCPSGQKQLMDVMALMLEHLQNLEVDHKELKSLPCVPVYSVIKSNKGGQYPVLVKPECVVFTASYVTRPFFPFIHSIQHPLLRASDILRQLGVQDSIDLKHMQIVLQSAFKISGERQLDPNTRDAVNSAMVKLDSLLKVDKPGEQIITEKLSPLYLPGTDGRLHPTELLVHTEINKNDIELEGKNIFLLWTPKDIFAEELCGRLPKILRPRRLSELCITKVSADCKESEIPDFLKGIIDTLGVPNLAKAMCLIVKSRVISEKGKERVGALFSEHVSKFLDSLKIHCVKPLKIDIFLQDDPENRIASHTCNCCIKEREQVFDLYVNGSIRGLDIADVLNEIAEQLLSCLRDTEVSDLSQLNKMLVNILKSESSDDVLYFLERNKIKSGEIEGEIDYDHRLILGARLPETLHFRLEQDSKNIFQPEEYVGYEPLAGDHVIVAQVFHVFRFEDDSGRPLPPQLLEYIIITSEEERKTGGRKVKAIEMYKFSRGDDLPNEAAPVAESESREIVLFSGDPNSSPSASQSPSPRVSTTRPTHINVEEAKEEIRQELKEFAKLDKQERKRAIRRLYLKWHPDKNPNNTEAAEEVFKFLLQELDRLDKGRIPGASNDDSDSFSFWRNFQRFWDDTARQHRQYHHQYRQGGGGSRSRSRRRNWQTNDFNYFFGGAYTPPRNMPESQVWVKQATVDDKVLKILLEQARADEKLSGHVCFMAHEVAEKALKGAMLATCGLRNNSRADHNIVPLANAIKHVRPRIASDLPDLARSLEPSYFRHTRFPQHSPTSPPCDHYTLKNAEDAEKCATEILRVVQQIVVL